MSHCFWSVSIFCELYGRNDWKSLFPILSKDKTVIENPYCFLRVNLTDRHQLVYLTESSLPDLSICCLYSTTTRLHTSSCFFFFINLRNRVCSCILIDCCSTTWKCLMGQNTLNETHPQPCIKGDSYIEEVSLCSLYHAFPITKNMWMNSNPTWKYWYSYSFHTLSIISRNYQMQGIQMNDSIKTKFFCQTQCKEQKEVSTLALKFSLLTRGRFFGLERFFPPL